LILRSFLHFHRHVAWTFRYGGIAGQLATHVILLHRFDLFIHCVAAAVQLQLLSALRVMWQTSLNARFVEQNVFTCHSGFLTADKLGEPLESIE
jgi:hypothetical protein